jgi:D-arabinose 1-dehydrogenase-like Zn-dependent alcohol dehydrogenase
MRSRAALLTEFKTKMSIGEIDIKEPKGESVLLRILGAGVCGSDVEIWKGNIIRKGFELPFVLGHENVGEVVEVGEKVKNLKPGDKVLVYAVWSDLTCNFCLEGRFNLCINMAVPGQSFFYGGFSDYMYIDSYRFLHKIKSGSITDFAPIADAGTTSYSAVKKSLAEIGNRTDSTAIVYGVGGIALYTIQIMRVLAPMIPIIAVSRKDEKLKFAEKLGADVAIKPSELEQTVKGFTSGDGKISVIDLVGSRESMININESLKTRVNSSIVLVGLYGRDGNFPVFDLVGNEKKIIGSNYGTMLDFIDASNLLEQKRIKSYVIQHPLDEVNLALDEIQDGSEIGRHVLCP